MIITKIVLTRALFKFPSYTLFNCTFISQIDFFVNAVTSNMFHSSIGIPLDVHFASYLTVMKIKVSFFKIFICAIIRSIIFIIWRPATNITLYSKTYCDLCKKYGRPQYATSNLHFLITLPGPGCS